MVVIVAEVEREDMFSEKSSVLDEKACTVGVPADSLCVLRLLN